MTFRIIEGPEGIQGSPEWHEFRKGKIGASDAAAIMGASPWETPLAAWERMVFDKKKPKTAAMERGNALEEKAREWVNKRLKVNFEPVVIQSEQYPELIASLDGFEMKGSIPFLLEIKCPGMQSHLDAINGIVPEIYYPQLQHQMNIADIDEMLYCSFDGDEGVIVVCYRNQEYCKKLFNEEMLFLKRLNDFVPPEPSNKDWVEISDLEANNKAHRYQELSVLIDELESERDSLKEFFTTEFQHPRSKIGSLKIQKIIRKGAIAYDKIEELKRINLEAYRKPPSSYWKIGCSEC